MNTTTAQHPSMTEPVVLSVDEEQQLLEKIEFAERNAARGCGQSDVLYEQRVQAAYADLLSQAPSAVREVWRQRLEARGYASDFEAYEAAPGECPLTGIETDCCPCGRHE